jgi:hypothetical protein
MIRSFKYLPSQIGIEEIRATYSHFCRSVAKQRDLCERKEILFRSISYMRMKTFYNIVEKYFQSIAMFVLRVMC